MTGHPRSGPGRSRPVGARRPLLRGVDPLFPGLALRGVGVLVRFVLADATHQELVRAHELSERALDRLDLAGEDEPDEDVNATEREAREERVDAAEMRATSADATEGREASADSVEERETSVDSAEAGETGPDGTGTTRT